MSAAFSLTLSNPDLKTGLRNTAYTDKQGGNKLDLVISNNSGEDHTIGSGSLSQYLTLKIAKFVMDDPGASKLTVDPAWQITLNSATDDHYYCFNLIPPASGLTIKNTDSGTIHLLDLEPGAKGSGLIQLSYQFDDVNSMNISATLVTCAMPDDGLRLLVGDSGALRFSFFINTINNGAIVVSPQPATDVNKIENKIQLQLVYQAATQKKLAAYDAGGLVSQWDPVKKPTFHIFFPYASADINSSIDHALTDCLKPGDENYNAITSARNINGSLDKDDPTVTGNTYWEIVQTGSVEDPSNLPAWSMTPLTANSFLFTADPFSDPGPELNIWLTHIFSDLPVANSSDTLFYFQWYNFPGFNDGIQVFSLQKELLAIHSFNARLLREDTGPCIQFGWDTLASSCSLNGNLSYGTTFNFKQPLTADQPMQTSYTLTAKASNNVSVVSQTLSVQWATNRGNVNGQFSVPLHVCVIPEYILVIDLVDNGPNSVASRVFFIDPLTLQHTNIDPIDVSDIILEMTVGPDTSTIFLTSPDSIYKINSWIHAPRSVSGASIPNAGDSPNTMGFTPDGSGIVVFNFDLEQDGSNPVYATLNVFKMDNLQLTGSKIFSSNPYLFAISPLTGKYLLAEPESLSVLDPQTYEHMPGSPVPSLLGIGHIAVSADEQSIYVLSLNLDETGMLTKLNGQTLRIEKQVKVPILWNVFFNTVMGYNMAPLLLSADGKQLFLAGMDGKAFFDSENSDSMNLVPLFLVFDTDTLEQPDWATKIQATYNGLVCDMAFSAIGDRIYVTAFDSGFPESPGKMYTIDAYFPT